jgi:STIP1 family protein 1
MFPWTWTDCPSIIIDPTNPLLYTNRAMCRLKLSLYPSVLADCAQSISLLPTHMKAYYYRAQAHLYINNPTEALEAAKKAYDITYLSTDLKDIKSLPNIVSLVLKCKKVVWEVREKERLGRREALLQEVIGGIEREKERRIKDIGIEDEEKKRLRVTEVEIEFDTKIEDVRAIWEKAATAEEKKRVVPDWAIDNISFNLMVDPVMVSSFLSVSLPFGTRPLSTPFHDPYPFLSHRLTGTGIPTSSSRCHFRFPSPVVITHNPHHGTLTVPDQKWSILRTRLDD